MELGARVGVLCVEPVEDSRDDRAWRVVPGWRRAPRGTASEVVARQRVSVLVQRALGPASVGRCCASWNARSCSCSAAIRPGTTVKGRAMRADDRRLHGLRLLGALMSCSESGRTSQNVSVISNGVWATAQKLAYSRRACRFGGSSGTIVKLICLDW